MMPIIAAAIEYAADHDYHIIHMSLAGPSPSNTLQNAADEAWNTGGEVFTDGTLKTSHSMSFRSCKGTTYVYEVSSADGVGNAATAGPFDYMNE